ncbi:hypothetical protein AMD27_06880 [Acinetobacter sp. TGL-Y2]|uniref:hypothetical protein n=1 Tax=Acinetobacter sp. TGL-Y2 TaxID=1407071 RepID=UPI0007A65D64|nr:hypothetical protein [Acinetobacter sp. TGL-Y2]AMW78634.1 hypothetical protein AMD27_06880 [Acinetobacter sp. TGL-Y2]
MDEKDYFWATKKRPPKIRPRSKPLPKAKEKYLEAEEYFEQALNILEIKYEKKFQFKSTKHWRFDFHLIEHRILVEISGGPWSGGRKGKLKDKAWSLDRYDDAAEMGLTVVRLESAERYRIEESGPLQIECYQARHFLRKLKRFEDGTDQTISTD